MKWQRKLNKKEMAHFRYATNGDMTLIGFKQGREAQKKLDSTNEVCWDCRFIAKKLGLE